MTEKAADFHIVVSDVHCPSFFPIFNYFFTINFFFRYTQYEYPPPQNDLYHHGYMYNPYHAGQRLSTTDSYYQSGGVDYNPNMDSSDPNDAVYHRNNNKGAVPPKTSGNSDNSSSGTLGMANNSLQGSLLSVNSGRPPSSAAKTRNITQV